MKILVFCLPGIGDALMATPMIKLLKKEYPKATIDVACMFEGVRYLFDHNPAVSKIHRLSLYKENPFKGLMQIFALRKEQYDISILAYPAFRREYHLIQWLAGGKKRISQKYGKGFWTELHFLNNAFVPFEEDEHIVINNLNLLKKLNIDWQKKLKPDEISYDLFLDKEDDTFGKKYIGDLGWKKSEIIALHPGSINSLVGMMKRWSVENYTDLAKELIKRGKKIMIFVGPDELDLGTQLFDEIGDDKNTHIIKSVSFNHAVGILNQVSMLISNDNGFAHLANALNIYTIVLFGPTNPIWCRPYNDTMTKTIRKANFKPWFRNDMKVTSPPPDVESGMDAIGLKDVLSVIPAKAGIPF